MADLVRRRVAVIATPGSNLRRLRPKLRPQRSRSFSASPKILLSLVWSAALPGRAATGPALILSLQSWWPSDWALARLGAQGRSDCRAGQSGKRYDRRGHAARYTGSRTRPRTADSSAQRQHQPRNRGSLRESLARAGRYPLRLVTRPLPRYDILKQGGLVKMIFINYRRDESMGMAGRLHDRLAQSFGRKNLFLDVDHIPPGVDFVTHLNKQVAACKFFIAVIGPNWLNVRNEMGERRLDDPDDFVTIEIAAALARDIRVIPVLVDGARMQKVEELPKSLKPLVRRQAIELRHAHFGRDAEALIEKIREAFSDKPLRLGRWRAAAAVLGALLLLGWVGLFTTGIPISVVQPGMRGQAEKERLAVAKAEERQAKAAAEVEARAKAEEAEKERRAAAEGGEERKAKAAAEAEARA